MKTVLIYIIINIIFLPVYSRIQALGLWVLGMSDKQESMLAFFGDNITNFFLLFSILLIPNILTFVIIRWKFTLTYNLHCFLFSSFFVLIYTVIRLVPYLN